MEGVPCALRCTLPEMIASTPPDDPVNFTQLTLVDGKPAAARCFSRTLCFSITIRPR